MSNRDDFDNVADELIEMFALDGTAGDAVTGTLRQRLGAELHNAFVAGQEAEEREWRGALTEALDGWQEASGRASRIGDKEEYARIAELRAKHLGKP